MYNRESQLAMGADTGVVLVAEIRDNGACSS